MKIKNRKKIIITFLCFAFIILLVYDFYIIRNHKKYSANTSIVKKKTNEMHKNFNYSDILNTIDNCSPNFILIKIEKNSVDKNFINTEVKYKGEIEGLIKGLKIMRTEEIIKDINDINITKTGNKEYIAEINVDFLKFK